MADDRVILSEEPSSVKINIQEPNKPKTVSQGGRMIKRPPKVSFWDKVISALFGSEVNSQNLGQHIIEDYAVPTAKRMINNGIQSGLKRTGDAAQVMLFGRVVNSNNGPTDYTSFSKPNNVQKPGGYRVMDKVDTFAFTSKAKADECLAYLKGRIQTYQSVGVLDYFEWINNELRMDIPLDYNMANRGWVDLSMATVSAAPEGFIIEFPRPIALQKG